MNTLNALFSWVLLASVRAALLVLAVLLARWILKNRLPSRWRYALWIPVLVALLVPALPLLPSWMQLPVVTPPTKASDSTLARSASTLVSVLPSQGVVLEETPAGELPKRTISAGTIEVQSITQPLSWRAWITITWIIGAMAAGLIVLVSFLMTLRRIKRTVFPADAELRARIEQIAASVGLRRVPRVVKSSAVVSPAVCGLWRPTLLLNASFPQTLSDEEADLVLRHELTHIRRGDLAVNALLCAVLTLHWFNPLLWLAFFRVRADREAACDAQVLDGEPSDRRAAYGHTLLKLETEFPPTGLCLGFVGILQRGGILRERIHAIISQPQLNQTMKIFTALSIVALTIVGVAKAAEAKPKQASEKNGSAAEASPPAIAAADVAKAKKVTAAEFAKEYAWVGKAQDMHEVSYLGQQDGKAFIRRRSMLGASSLSGKWSEIIIYAQVQELAPELRVELEKAGTKQATDAALPIVGDYMLKVTHVANNLGSDLGPDRAIPEAVYKPTDDARLLQLRISDDGKHVSIGGKSGLGTLEKQTKSEQVYSLSEVLPTSGQLSIRQTADGLIGTYTIFGSGWPVLESSRGVMTPAKAGAKGKLGGNAEQARPVDLNSIKDKVSVKFGEDTVVKLQREGDRLLPRAPGVKAEANDVVVKLAIQETTDTPFPVEGDPTRSYLSMSNGADKWLRFRALARRKGSKDFYEVPDPLDPVEPGEMTLIKCWESGTILEEVILFDLALTQKPAN